MVYINLFKKSHRYKISCWESQCLYINLWKKKNTRKTDVIPLRKLSLAWISSLLQRDSKPWAAVSIWLALSNSASLVIKSERAASIVGRRDSEPERGKHVLYQVVVNFPNSNFKLSSFFQKNVYEWYTGKNTHLGLCPYITVCWPQVDTSLMDTFYK